MDKLKKSILFSSAIAICVATSAQEHIQDTDPLYLVYLNPFVIQEYLEEEIKNGYTPPQIPEIIKDDEKISYLQKNIEKFIYSPGVERLTQELTQKFSLNRVRRTAAATAGFYANLSESEVKALENSGYVVSLEKASDEEEGFTFSTAYDYTVGGEIVTWAKQDTGTNDNISVSNNFYIVDGPYNSPALVDEINIASTNTSGTGWDHPASVLSLAVGKNNGTKIRGINPGQPVIHVGTPLTLTGIRDSISTISSTSEWLGQFSTLNLSLNTTNPTTNAFSHNAILGQAIRRASGRLLVTQSAGNFNRNACTSAYNINGAADSRDGILVVGGTDRFGKRYPATANPPPYATEDRSNYGPCVEVWAPGQQMTTTLANGSIVTATGTSFAAPVVAAIAGRYGDATTRPIERETYIRNGMYFTGNYEGATGSNLPINVVKYTPPWQHSISKRLPVTAAYSITNTKNLNKLIDQKFYDGIDWNAYGSWGSIVLDLGAAKNLSGIRVMIRSSANGGQLNFAVHGSNSISISAPNIGTVPSNPIAYFNTNNQFDLTPYHIPISGLYRYVMLEASNAVSWLSYAEIEVYGK